MIFYVNFKKVENFLFLCIFIIIMKYKTIKINEELHNLIKKFCDDYDYKLNKWCETHLTTEFRKECSRLNYTPTKKGKILL